MNKKKTLLARKDKNETLQMLIKENPYPSSSVTRLIKSRDLKGEAKLGSKNVLPISFLEIKRMETVNGLF